MKILVIIVTYNAMQWAERCFNSLRNSSLVPDVFVVDNGSTDGTQNYIQEHFLKVLFLQSKENLGFGKANNLGLQYALDNDYDYVYLLNQDAWVLPDTFEKLIEISRRNPDFGILSPFQMNADLLHIDSGFKRNVCSWESSPNMLDYLYLGSNKEVYDVKKVMAAHWFLTKKCIMKVGGFSLTFPHYGEDINYCNRVLYHGYKIGVVPSLKVIHDRKDRKDNKEKKIYLRYISLLGYMSSPERGNCVKPLSELLFLIVKYKSWSPLRYAIKIAIHYGKIKRNRIITMSKDCAFLFPPTKK